MFSKRSDEFPLLTVKHNIDLRLEIDKLEGNHENDSISLASVTF